MLGLAGDEIEWINQLMSDENPRLASEALCL